MGTRQTHRSTHRRKGVESSQRLGRHRSVIKRTPRLSGYRRLSLRYERDPDNDLGVLALAAAICCFKRLARHAI